MGMGKVLKSHIPSRMNRCRIPVRFFSGIPSNTAYYKLDPSCEDILGSKRIESTKIEAALRRLAEKLFLYDSAQRALVEDDMESFSTGGRYLRDFLDTRDAVPRQLPTSQTQMGRHLRKMLDAVKRKETGTVSDIAKLFWAHQIRRTSTFHLVAREMLQMGHPQVAEDILQSMLMTRKSGLTASTYTLCLEASMHNNNHQWFMDLAKTAMLPPSKWGSTQSKFQSTGTLDFAGPLGITLLAEGFMKFGHPHLLDKVLEAGRSQHATTGIKLLTINMEAANRWRDLSRSYTTLNEFERIWDPSNKLSVRFLLVARRNRFVYKRAMSLSETLPKKMQQFYFRMLPFSGSYFHPYAC